MKISHVFLFSLDPFFRRVLPSPISHSLYPNYGSMKLKGPAWR